MKRSVLAILILCAVLLFTASCNGDISLPTTTENIPPASDPEPEFCYYEDGVKKDSIPSGDDYIVYIRSEDNSEWVSWNYTEHKVENAEAGKKYNVYFFKVDRIFDSIEDLEAATDLAEGMKVGVLSYYKGEDRGTSLYKISKKAISKHRIWINKKTLIASLTPFEADGETIVTVDMFGTAADGKSPDQEQIINAFRFGASTVEFEGEEYLQTDCIVLSNGNITINGKGANIKNSYKNGVVNDDFRISGENPLNPIHNVVIENLTLTCSESRGEGALYNAADHVQLRGGNVHYATVRNCNFYVPEVDGVKKQVDSIWFQGGISDIVIEGCNIVNHSNSVLGGGIWLSASDASVGYKCENVIIRNNYVEKNSCDEVLALFMGDFEDVLIENNTFISQNHVYPKMFADNGIGIGVWNIETHCKNIRFIGNTVKLSLKGTAFIFSDADELEFADNKIYVTTNFGDFEDFEDPNIINHAIFRLPETDKGYKVSNCNVHDNYIEVNCSEYVGSDGYNLRTFAEAFDVTSEFNDNEIVLNCVLKQLTSKDSAKYRNNKITVNGDILYPQSRSNSDFDDSNKVIINKK